MKVVIAVLLLVTAACTLGPRAQDAPGTSSRETRAAARIDGATAKRLVGNGALLLDVRSPEEFTDGHIEGARNIPVNELDAAMPTLPKDKPIVVYCAVGARATTAASRLAAAGFEVHNLGAMASWGR